jgi:hypothetical protein
MKQKPDEFEEPLAPDVLAQLEQGPSPPPALEEKTLRRLRARGLLRDRSRAWRVALPFASAAMAATIGLVVGLRAGQAGERARLLAGDAPRSRVPAAAPVPGLELATREYLAALARLTTRRTDQITEAFVSFRQIADAITRLAPDDETSLIIRRALDGAVLPAPLLVRREEPDIPNVIWY